MADDAIKDGEGKPEKGMNTKGEADLLLRHLDKRCKGKGKEGKSGGISSSSSSSNSSSSSSVCVSSRGGAEYQALLPREIWVEIMSRMGVKDLLRLSSVCKDWQHLLQELLQDRAFIEKHMNRDKADPLYYFTLMKVPPSRSRREEPEYDEIYFRDGYMHVLGGHEDYNEDDYLLNVGRRVLCGCDGMILTISCFYQFILRNPATRQGMSLPPPPCRAEYLHNPRFTMSFIPSTASYKIFYMSEDPVCRGCFVSSTDGLPTFIVDDNDYPCEDWTPHVLTLSPIWVGEDWRPLYNLHEFVPTFGGGEDWRPLNLPKPLPSRHFGFHCTQKLSVASAGASVVVFRVTEFWDDHDDEFQQEDRKEVVIQLMSIDLDSETFTSTFLDPALFSNWTKVWALNWNGRPTLAVVGTTDLTLLEVEMLPDYKTTPHKLALPPLQTRFSVRLPMNSMPCDPLGLSAAAASASTEGLVVPLLVERNILWLFVKVQRFDQTSPENISDRKIMGYHIKSGRVTHDICLPENRTMLRSRHIGRESLARPTHLMAM